MTKISDYFNFKTDWESAIRNGHTAESAVKAISFIRQEPEEYIKTILRNEIKKLKKHTPSSNR